MQIKLHQKAATTPAIRKAIQTSQLSVRQLADRYGVSLDTIYKWKSRSDVYDRSHARHNLLSSLNDREEEVVLELRRRLYLSIDDIVTVMHRSINAKLSRSAIYRCLRRNGAHCLEKKDKVGRSYSPFSVEAKPGFIHLDVKHLPRLDGHRSYIYVGIDRATRYVYAETLYDLKAETAAGFVRRLIADFSPLLVRVVLSDNGFEWTDRCAGGVKKKATGLHPVDRLCAEEGIEHRLTKIRRPQTNGMVERFNLRISQSLERKEKIKNNSGKNCFPSHKERNAFMRQFVFNYNRTRQNCLNQHAPLQLIQSHHPHSYHAKDDTSAGECDGCRDRGLDSRGFAGLRGDYKGRPQGTPLLPPPARPCLADSPSRGE